MGLHTLFWLLHWRDEEYALCIIILSLSDKVESQVENFGI